MYNFIIVIVTIGNGVIVLSVLLACGAVCRMTIFWRSVETSETIQQSDSWSHLKSTVSSITQHSKPQQWTLMWLQMDVLDVAQWE